MPVGLPTLPSCPATPLPGYKASAVLDTSAKIGATDIAACEKGKYSNWLGTNGARVPADATTCQACADGYVAPRTGERLVAWPCTTMPVWLGGDCVDTVRGAAW